MSNYSSGSLDDQEMLAGMPSKRLLDFFFLQIRNLWRVDGLYFLGIENEFDTETATKIDAGVWQIMAKIEAKSLQRMFKVDEKAHISVIMSLLRKSSWALDQPFKTVTMRDGRAILTVNRCRTQETRLRKGLREFPCKKVRLGYLKNFVKTLNSEVEVGCLVCPPDEHPPDLWCRWELRL